ncbi:MAG TPA: nuclease-related domain-containing protein [Solirubrobacterales bacterium]
MRALALGSLALLVLLVALLGLRGWPLVAVELAVIAAIAVASRVIEPRFDRWLQGAQGEEHVGEILDGLANRGWHVTHDVSLGRGNIDHVLVGPAGIFAIETKSNRGRVSIDRLDQRMLAQSYAEKKLVERITGLKVQALLVFSQAWLIGRVPAQRRGVTVLPARMLAWFLSRRRPTLSIEQARELHQRLAMAFGQPAKPVG